MAHGFFHPDKGYWQTNTYPAEKYRAEYPEGYVEVPLKPSQHHHYTGNEWVEVLPPEFDALTHKIELETVRDGDTFSYSYNVVELPLDVAEKGVRAKRTALLAETDWVVPYYLERGEPVPAEWQAYRQALRDVTAQEGFPYSVNWPTKP